MPTSRITIFRIFVTLNEESTNDGLKLLRLVKSLRGSETVVW